MSWTRQTVVFGPNFSGLGNRPSRTPCHQVERLTGIGPRGARMSGSRTNPTTAGLWAPSRPSRCQRTIDQTPDWGCGSVDNGGYSMPLPSFQKTSGNRNHLG